MEMPEGWGRFCNHVDDGEADTYEELKSLGILMKEMAEALEDLLRNKDQTDIPWVKYNRLLDRFKDWK